MNCVRFGHLDLLDLRCSIVKGGKAREQVRENAAHRAHLFRLVLRA